MKKLIILFTIFTFSYANWFDFISSFIGNFFNFSNTIVVDPNVRCRFFVCTGACTSGDSYKKTIADALDEAQNGDTIKICPATYNENNLIITQNNLKIIGMGYKSTDVNITNSSLSVKQNIFSIKSNISNLDIENLYIEQTDNTHSALYSNYRINGLYVNNISILSNHRGIYLSNKSKNVIIYKSFFDTKDESIYFSKLQGDVNITSNVIQNSSYGIRLFQAKKSGIHIIKDNLVKNTTQYGLKIESYKRLNYKVTNNCFEKSAGVNVFSQDKTGYFDKNFYNDWSGSGDYKIDDIPVYDTNPQNKCNKDDSTIDNSADVQLNSVDYISGSCNAINDWDHNITTKISNNDFNLTILSKTSSTPISTQIQKVDLYLYQTSDCSGDYKIQNICNGNCPMTLANGCATLENIKVSNANKCVIVHIATQDNDSNSTDNFAIRPYQFIIKKLNFFKAGNEFNITIDAVDKNNNPVKDYNESLSNVVLDLNEIDNNCINGDFSIIDGDFQDGEANITLKYSEIGDVNISIKDKDYAQVDDDDTNDVDRLISPNSMITTSIPDHFEISNISVKDFGDFTYLSRDLNMSGEFNFTITAKNKDNIITKNYSSQCYAKDVDINISHSSDTDMQGLNYIITQLSKNTKDNNISFVYDRNNFSDGESNVSLNINFDRNYSLPVTEFNLNLKDLYIKDQNNTTALVNLNKSLYFIYAKTTPINITTDKSEVNVTIKFQKYNGFSWVSNSLHNNKIYGDVNDTYPSDSISLNEDKINSEQNITIQYDSIRPYKLTLHLNIPSWMWYGQKEYKAPSSDNLDCNTHPCVNVLFISPSSQGWGGTGDSNKVPLNNTISTEINATNDNENFIKLNW